MTTKPDLNETQSLLVDVILDLRERSKKIEALEDDETAFFKEFHSSAEDYDNQTITSLTELLKNKISAILESFYKSEHQNQYEKMLQKLENDVRSHIRLEQQLKLHIENMQTKLEELEKAREEDKLKEEKLQEVKNDNSTLMKALKRAENEIVSLKKENDRQVEITRKAEETLMLYEKKLRMADSRATEDTDLSSNRQDSARGGRMSPFIEKRKKTVVRNGYEGSVLDSMKKSYDDKPSGGDSVNRRHRKTHERSISSNAVTRSTTATSNPGGAYVNGNSSGVAKEQLPAKLLTFQNTFHAVSLQNQSTSQSFRTPHDSSRVEYSPDVSKMLNRPEDRGGAGTTAGRASLRHSKYNTKSRTTPDEDRLATVYRTSAVDGGKKNSYRQYSESLKNNVRSCSVDNLAGTNPKIKSRGHSTVAVKDGSFRESKYRNVHKFEKYLKSHHHKTNSYSSSRPGSLNKSLL
eukprot:CAMPEP_0115011048 /NCGR_PEP_ID=MMETSP0216-20121206/23737_1 /TAXON_ID=223996 /ORGANISM="Protocruzia adherens, Strain Boccale" /LENGTH=463 /DNA_ID=CAMNT_0002379495 /DNA_START=18 /DNA_END=1409 /DNA_ORIENTATION=-